MGTFEVKEIVYTEKKVQNKNFYFWSWIQKIKYKDREVTIKTNQSAIFFSPNCGKKKPCYKNNFFFDWKNLDFFSFLKTSEWKYAFFFFQFLDLNSLSISLSLFLDDTSVMVCIVKCDEVSLWRKGFFNVCIVRL